MRTLREKDLKRIIADRDMHAAEMILRRGIYELTSDCKTIGAYGFQGCHA